MNPNFLCPDRGPCLDRTIARKLPATPCWRCEHRNTYERCVDLDELATAKIAAIVETGDRGTGEYPGRGEGVDVDELCATFSPYVDYRRTR